MIRTKDIEQGSRDWPSLIIPALSMLPLDKRIQVLVQSRILSPYRIRAWLDQGSV